MTKDLKEALKLIRKECNKYRQCAQCPLSYEDWNNHYCLLSHDIPAEWKLEEVTQ